MTETANLVPPRPNYTILHSFSGGIDSTSVLLQLIENKEEILLHHLQIKPPGNVRWEAEALAVERILDWLRANTGFEPRCIYGGFENMSWIRDVELVGFAAGGILRHHKDIHRMSLSTSLTDRQQETWHVRHGSRIDLVNSLARRPIELVNPNWDKTREHVIAAMPPDLLKLCSWCRAPHRLTYEPCYACHACNVTIPFLKAVIATETATEVSYS